MDNVVLVSGPEDYLISGYIKKVKNKVENPDFNFSVFNEINEAYIIETCQQVPFMNDYRVVLVYGELFKGKHELLESYIKKPCPSTILMFVTSIDKRVKLFKSIEKLVKIHIFKKLDANELTKFITEYLVENNKSLSQELVKIFIEKTGYLSVESILLFNVVSELDRLISLAGSNEITSAIIDTMKQPAETNVFKLIGHISKRSPGAITYLQGLLNEGTNEMQILGSLLWHYRLVYKAKATDAKKVGSTDYNLKDFDALLDRKTVKQIIESIIEAQNKIKRGLDSRLALEIVVSEMISL